MARIDTELLGLQIVALDDASVVGEVDALIIDDASMNVAGFLVDLSLYEASVLPFSAVQAIGNDAIIVASASALIPVTADAGIEALANKDISISEAKAITRSGKTVGIIGDFFVDTESGAIEGMEFIATVQTGYQADVSVLPSVSVIRLGRDIIVLADDYHQRLQRDATSLARLKREDTGTMTVTPREASVEAPAAEAEAEPEPEAEAAAPAGWAKTAETATEPETAGLEPEQTAEPESALEPEPMPEPEPADAVEPEPAAQEEAVPDEPVQEELQFEEPAEPEPVADPEPELLAEPEAVDEQPEPESEVEVVSADEEVPAAEEVPAVTEVLETGEDVTAETEVVAVDEDTAPEAEQATETPMQSAMEAAETPAAPRDASAAPAEDTLATQQRHFLVGKRVLRRIETPNGEVVAEEGDLVTYEMIQKAKSSDQLLILSLNVE